MTELRLVLGMFRRYAPALVVWTAVACLPFLAIALATDAPADRAGAQTSVRLVWVIAGTAWIIRLVLVGAFAPAARAIANDRSLGQLGSLRTCGAGLVRAILPCALAVAAIAIGSLALVVPGFMLLALLSLTGASERTGVAEPLADSIAVARGNRRAIAIVVGAMLLVDFAIAAVAYLVVLELPSKAKPVHLETVRTLIQVVAIGVLVATPFAASALAAIRARAPSASG